MDTPDVKVFIVNVAGHDFDGAKRFGALEFLTTGWVSMQQLDRVKFQLATDIKKKSSENDWLLLSGKNIVCVLAALIWYRLHKQVKLLVHDHKFAGEYREVTLTEKNLDGLMAVLADVS